MTDKYALCQEAIFTKHTEMPEIWQRKPVDSRSWLLKIGLRLRSSNYAGQVCDLLRISDIIIRTGSGLIDIFGENIDGRRVSARQRFMLHHPQTQMFGLAQTAVIIDPYFGHNEQRDPFFSNNHIYRLFVEFRESGVLAQGWKVMRRGCRLFRLLGD